MPKISELNSLSGLYSNDYFVVAHDVAGLPSTNKITLADFANTITSNTFNFPGFVPRNGSNGQILISSGNDETFWAFDPDVKAFRFEYVPTYTVTPEDDYIFCDPVSAGGNMTIVLPTSGTLLGKEYNIKNLTGEFDINYVTVTTDQPNNNYIENPVDGSFANSYIVQNKGDLQTWMYDGTFWRHTGSQTGSPIFFMSANTYQQVVIKNTNSGQGASGDLVIYNDQGDYLQGTGPFIDLGLDSSNYVAKIYGNIWLPNDGYVYTGNANLLLGTSSPGTDIKFFTGTANTNSIKLYISDSLTPGIIANTGIIIQEGGGGNPPILVGNTTLVTVAQSYDGSSNTYYEQGMLAYPGTVQSVVEISANGNYYSFGTTLGVQNSTFATFETNARILADAGISTANIVSGNILPSANNTYSLGSPNYQWSHLYVSNNTIYINNIPLSINDSGKIIVNNIDVVNDVTPFVVQQLTDVTFNAGNATTEHGLNDIILEGGSASSSITGAIEAGNSIIIPISSNMGPIGYTGSAGTGGSGSGSSSTLANGEFAVSLNANGIMVMPPGNETTSGWIQWSHASDDLDNVAGVGFVDYFTAYTGLGLSAPGGGKGIWFGTPADAGDPFVPSTSMVFKDNSLYLPENGFIKSHSFYNHGAQLSNDGPSITIQTANNTSSQFNWVFDSDGNLNVPGSIGFPNGNAHILSGMGFHIRSEEPISIEVQSNTWSFGTDGVLTIPGEIHTAAGTGNVVITSSDGASNHSWIFASNGVLIIPDNGGIQNTTGYSVLGVSSSGVLTNESLSSNTALDLNKQLHILAGTASSPKTYTLADGVVGQQVFFIPAQGYTDNGVGSVVITLNATINNGGNYQFGGSKSWNPFAPSTYVYVNANASTIPSPSAIFDGVGWVISGGSIS